jgi:phosphoserine phosphatase RsbU/P
VLYDPNGMMTWGDTLAVSVLAIGWALSVRGVRRKGSHLIDAKFDRQKYDYRRATDELADTLSANITTESIAGAIVNTLTEHMLLQRVGVLLYRDNQQLPCVTDSAGLSEEQHITMSKKIDERFHTAIAKYTGDSRLSVVSLPSDIARELSALGFRYVMPIRTNKWMSGILMIGEKKSEASFNREDFSFMSAFVRQCTIALDNALLYEQLTEQQRLEHELNIARDIQIMSLPQRTPNVKGLDIAGASIPAMEVGGDFYDYLVYEEHEMMVVVGDVSGKGTSAALYMSKVQGIMRTLRDFHLSPRDIFNRMNQLIYEELHRRSFITALSGLFHTQLNAMVLARAGHLPLYHYRAESFDVMSHQPKGIGLGITSQKHFSPHLELQRIDYKTGDVFVFVTDGITEARNEAQEEFGEEALINTILLNAQRTADEIREAILESTIIFQGTEKQFDDMTVVVIKIKQ